MNIAWLKFGDVSTKQTSYANLEIYSPVVAIRLYVLCSPLFEYCNIFRWLKPQTSFDVIVFVNMIFPWLSMHLITGPITFAVVFSKHLNANLSRLTQQFFVDQFLGGFCLRPIETKPYLREGICTR